MPTTAKGVPTQAGLLRQLGIASATALVVSNMIGTGIFTSTGFLAGQLGDPYLVLAIWVVGAVFALLGAFCYSELGVNFPSSGGEYVYLTRAYGPTWGFMTGWVSFFAGFSAPIAINALAFSNYLGYFFPELKQENGTWPLFGYKVGGAQVTAAALILVFTILNIFGVQRMARIQNALTSFKIVVLLAFLVFAFFIGEGNWGHFSMQAARTSEYPVAQQFVLSLFWIYVAYSGWNAATYVAEELKQPGRTLPIALTYGTAAVALLYLAMNVVFIYSAPLEAMKNVVAVGSLSALRLFGEGIAGVFSALMAIGIVSSVSAMVTIGPRVYYAMAKNGAFFPAAAQVHPRWHTPVNAILWQGACAMIMAFTPFAQLFSYIGITLNFTAVMAVSAIFYFRRRRPDWQKLRVVSFAYPLVPATFILVGLWMAIYGLTLQPKVALISLATILLGALVFKLRRA